MKFTGKAAEPIGFPAGAITYGPAPDTITVLDGNDGTLIPPATACTVKVCPIVTVPDVVPVTVNTPAAVM